MTIWALRLCAVSLFGAYPAVAQIADFSLSATPSSRDVCQPNDATYDVTVGSISGYSDPVTLSASGEPAGTTASFGTNPATPPGSSLLTISNTGAASVGMYNIDILGIAPTSTHTTTVSLGLFSAAPGPVSLVSPPDGATNVSLQPSFSWNPVAQGAQYSFALARDPGFLNVVLSTVVPGTSLGPIPPLQHGTMYYWRVRADNACGPGALPSVFSFTTSGLAGAPTVSMVGLILLMGLMAAAGIHSLMRSE